MLGVFKQFASGSSIRLVVENLRIALSALWANKLRSVLTTLGIEPPELSSWDWGLAAGRMRRI